MGDEPPDGGLGLGERRPSFAAEVAVQRRRQSVGEGAERGTRVEVDGDAGRQRDAVAQPRGDRLHLGDVERGLGHELGRRVPHRLRLLGDGVGERLPGGEQAGDAGVPRRDAAGRPLGQDLGDRVAGVARRSGRGLGHLGERVAEAVEHAEARPRSLGGLEEPLLERDQRPREVAGVDRGDVARRHHGARLGAVPVVEVPLVALQGLDRVQHLAEADQLVAARDVAEVARRLDGVERQADVGRRRAAGEALRGLHLEVVRRQPAVAFGEDGVEEAPRPPGDRPQADAVARRERVLVAVDVAADVARDPGRRDPGRRERERGEPRDGLGERHRRQHHCAPDHRRPHRVRHVAGRLLGLLRGRPFEEVLLRNDPPPERPPDGIQHHDRLVGQEDHRQADLAGVHLDVGPDHAEPARRDRVGRLEQEAVRGGCVDREREHEQRDQRPHERRAGQDRPREQQEDQQRGRRQAAAEVVEQLPTADDRERVLARPPAGVLHARHQPRQQLPVAPHPAMLAERERGVARREVVEHFHAGRERRAGVVALQEVV